jgi:methionyl-tRNA formyltransferase
MQMGNGAGSALRIALAGSVVSSRRALQGLLRHRAKLVGVLGLSPGSAGAVSGYSRLDDLADSAGIPYAEFRSINDRDVLAAVRAWQPDLLFVVGLSQLVKPELLGIPRLGCVGFHPTWLPQGRGRAPVAWLTLDARAGAATFFLMEEGVDSGPILAQEPFHVSTQDYAGDVVAKLELAIDRALDGWLPRLLEGSWDPRPQHHERATYDGRRTPEDGLIDWAWPAPRIHDLVRAASRPHPGAYTYVSDRKLVVWRAELETDMPFRGVVGRILHLIEGKGLLVQTGDGLLWLTEVELPSDVVQGTAPHLRVGVQLGYSPQDEIYIMKQRIARLEHRLALLDHPHDPNR